MACNDDFYPDYVSKIENWPLLGGVTYYLVIDGYGGDAGEYVLNIAGSPPPCVLDCGPGYTLEDEPPLVDDYQDAFNGGCNSPEFGNPFSFYDGGYFCGTSGWYLNMGTEARDTDWFVVPIDQFGLAEVYVDAEFPTYVFELGPQDCGNVAVLQDIEVGPCEPGWIILAGEPGSDAWLWVGPTTFAGPVNEYTYTMFRAWVSPTESHSWSAVKGLFE